MTRFSKLSLNEHGKVVETYVRDIPQSAMLACPHFIIVAEHYRTDNTCRCNDVKHTEMHEWGYEWDNSKQQWTAPQEDNDAA